jgi:hypothetical protein
MVNGSYTLITNRLDGFETENNELAGDYLEEQLEQYGLIVRSERFQERGRNVIATQAGMTHPDIKYIICAHYDAARFQYPGADDNASGTAAVLEAARLLSEYSFDYTIEYCLWDAEERGLVGSGVYANAARQRGDSILGVINLDMIAWDSDDDMRACLEYNNDSALELVWMMQSVNTTYDVGLDLYVRVRSTTPSDNYSFTKNNYPSFLFIEDWADFNTHYHGLKDTPDNLNVPFFTGITKVAVGGLAILAGVNDPLGVSWKIALIPELKLLTPAPHPFRTYAQLRFVLPRRQHARLELLDMMGRRVALLTERTLDAGMHQLSLDASEIPGGTYVLRLSTDSNVSYKHVLHSR